MDEFLWAVWRSVSPSPSRRFFFAELAHRIESISWGDLCVTLALMPC